MSSAEAVELEQAEVPACREQTLAAAECSSEEEKIPGEHSPVKTNRPPFPEVSYQGMEAWLPAAHKQEY